MDSNDSAWIQMILPSQGSTKHSITLTGEDDVKGPIVKDLSDALTKATGVPQTSQKLIFKGALGLSFFS